ncbi:unnamed protein product, partial [Rodentolepis nana]|uniref:AGC-kinase C-terminal domain-containing protein n=1 Tax=Rodentolepis nana TaxID=102285 RepID=A0A0R3TDZ3_RODNA
MTLERQGDILSSKHQQHQIYDKRTYPGRLGNNAAKLPRKSPLSALKAPKRSSRMSNSEEFAYDGPQAFEVGNPDLLDSPFRATNLSTNKLGSAPPVFGENIFN